MQQRRKLDLGNAPQLVEVESFTFADIPSVVVHRVSDGTGTFEELGGWEPVLIEWLVVRAADWSEAELEFRAVKRGNVGGEVCDFWGSNTTSPKSANRCVSFGKECARLRESQLSVFPGGVVGQHIGLDHQCDVRTAVTKLACGCLNFCGIFKRG